MNTHNHQNDVIEAKVFGLRICNKTGVHTCRKGSIHLNEREAGILQDFWDTTLTEQATQQAEAITAKREQLAELEHEQWMRWSKSIEETEDISIERTQRWQKLWCPYSELTEVEKDQDRGWADRVLAIMLPPQPKD